MLNLSFIFNIILKLIFQSQSYNYYLFIIFAVISNIVLKMYLFFHNGPSSRKLNPTQIGDWIGNKQTSLLFLPPGEIEK